MADRGTAIARPIWIKQAEEAKLKSEAEKAAAAKAAFEATFKDVDKGSAKETASSDSEAEEAEELKNKPVGPVDPAKCTAAGAGIAGGAACAPASFVVVTKDSDGRRIQNGGAQLKVKILPGVGVGGSEHEGIAKDQGDGTYTITYAVSKRGNYMVHVECNGKLIMGSPFPVFFSAGTVPAAGGLFPSPVNMPASSPFPNLVNQTMPNMPNYSGSVSGAFPGLLGMIPGILPGASGGAILPSIGASLGEVCRDYLNGKCGKTDCKFNHPPHNLLMAALAATTNMGTLSHMPMAPSAAAMAAAQAIVAAQALQAHAAQAQAQAQIAGDSPGSPNRERKADALKKTLQVSNLSPLLTVDQLKQLFSYCGTVVECSITDSKHFAYIEYSKPEEATAALALNNMDVGNRPLNVEMAKSFPSKAALANSAALQSSLPMVMQQAVAVQQMQFQQALIMQQTMASQQAASRAATMKSATEMASARAAEISKKLKADGNGIEDKEPDRKSRSPSTSRPRSKSRSRSPIKYWDSHRRSHSLSPPIRYPRERRARSPLRSRYHTSYSNENRRSYRYPRNSKYARHGRREWDRSCDHYSSLSRRNRRSVSPRTRKSSRAGSVSPKRHRESASNRTRNPSQFGSASPKHCRESKSSPRRAYETSSHHTRHSTSLSAERGSPITGKPSRAGSASPKHRRESKSSPGHAYETSSHCTRHSMPLLANCGHLSTDAKDVRKSEKLKADYGELDNTNEAIKEQHSVNNPRDLWEDGPTVSATSAHVKSSLLSLDETIHNERDLCGQEKLEPDHRNPEKINATFKDHDLVKNDSMDLRDDTGTTFYSTSKFHQRSSGSEEDGTLSGRNDVCVHEGTEPVMREHDSVGYDLTDFREDRRDANPTKSKHDRRSSKLEEDKTSSDARDQRRYEKHRKPDRIDLIVKERDFVDHSLKESREDRRTCKRRSASPEDAKYRSRDDMLKSEYRKQEKTDRQDHVYDDSADLKEERRADDSSDTRTCKRRPASPEDAKYHSRHEKSKSEYQNLKKSARRDHIGDDLGALREGRRIADFTDSRIYKRRSLSPEDAQYLSIHEKSKAECWKHEKSVQQDHIDYDLRDLREDRRRITDSSDPRTYKRRSVSPEDAKYLSRHNKPKSEYRKYERTGQQDHSDKHSRDFSSKDRRIADSSDSRTYKRRSTSPEDAIYLSRHDRLKSEYRKHERSYQQDHINDDSMDLREERRIVDSLDSRTYKRSSGNYIDYDSMILREDRRTTDFSRSSSHKRSSVSLETASSRGTKDRSRYEKSTADYQKLEKADSIIKGQDNDDYDASSVMDIDKRNVDSSNLNTRKRSLTPPAEDGSRRGRKESRGEKLDSKYAEHRETDFISRDLVSILKVDRGKPDNSDATDIEEAVSEKVSRDFGDDEPKLKTNGSCITAGEEKYQDVDQRIGDKFANNGELGHQHVHDMHDEANGMLCKGDDDDDDDDHGEDREKESYMPDFKENEPSETIKSDEVISICEDQECHFGGMDERENISLQDSREYMDIKWGKGQHGKHGYDDDAGDDDNDVGDKEMMDGSRSYQHMPVPDSGDPSLDETDKEHGFCKKDSSWNRGAHWDSSKSISQSPSYKN